MTTRFRFCGDVTNLPLNYTTPAMEQERTLVALYVHLDAAATTSENLVLTLDSHLGADYDTVLYTLDLAAGSTVDIASLDINAPLAVGDALRLTYTNTDNVTLAYQIVIE